MVVLSRVRQTAEYTVVKELSEERSYPVRKLCPLVGVSRAAYYKWLNREKSQLELENEALLAKIHYLEDEHKGTLGCERITMYVNKGGEVHYNVKRIRRVMRYGKIECQIRRKRPGYIRSTPQITAENVLNRQFSADAPNQKWVTDVTEFKYGSSQKAYLSAILDLADRRIVSWVLGHSNNNALVFETFNHAIRLNSCATPLLHSDRGFQYTNRVFKTMLDTAGIMQSMSRVGRCIDNGPMEGFWGTLKSEMYYRRHFKTYEELKTAVAEYITYYNERRLQKKLNAMSPLEYHRLMA